MANSKESLRNGKIVTFKDGVKGRLNSEDQSLELSDGRRLPLSAKNKRDLFPANEEAKKYARKREQTQDEIKNSFGGEFLYQVGQKGGVGGLRDIVEKTKNNPQDYKRQKQVEHEISEEISEESPFTSFAANLGSMALDVYATRGLSAAKAAPIIAGASAGSRIFEEPGEVGKEALIASMGGKFLDKFVAGAGKIAARRGARRALPAQQEAVKAQNLAGKNATIQGNVKARETYGKEAGRIENENAALQHQYNLEMNSRENQIIQDKNLYQQKLAQQQTDLIAAKNAAEIAKTQRSADAAALEADYQSKLKNFKMAEENDKLVQKRYKEDLRDLPRQQARAQEEHSRGVAQSAEQIKKSFHKSAVLVPEEVGLGKFLTENVGKSGLAGSTEANQAGKILKSLFPETGVLPIKELGKRYKSLEEAIQRSSPPVQQILNDFKVHLSERLTNVAADKSAYTSVISSLVKNIEKDVDAILLKIKKVKPATSARIKENISNILKFVPSKNFSARLQNGELNKEIIDKVTNIANFFEGVNPKDINAIMKAKKNANWKMAVQGLENQAKPIQQEFLKEIGDKINNHIARLQIQGAAASEKTIAKLGKNLKGTLGLAEPIPPPSAPAISARGEPPLPPGQLPQIPPVAQPAPIAPPGTPSMPIKPSLNGLPQRPVDQTFLAQPEPNLAAPQGFSEHAGDLLEKNLLSGGSKVLGKNIDPLLKLGGLKYLLGKAALPAEAGYLAAKGLTSPTGAGEVARQSFKQIGIQAIEMMMQKYPSYRNGVLENPQERRSLTKEIEDDYDIPLEQKAILESKVNRGKPLSQPL